MENEHSKIVMAHTTKNSISSEGSSKTALFIQLFFGAHYSVCGLLTMVNSFLTQELGGQ